MPKVGSSNEALYERATFVYTGSLWVPLKSDASGQLAVGLIADQAVESDGHGYYNAGWRANPLTLGYSGPVRVAVTVSSAPAGDNLVASSAVPANTLWVIKAISAQDAQHAPTQIILQVYDGSTGYNLTAVVPTVANQLVTWTGAVVLVPGEVVRVYFAGVTLNDTINLKAIGDYITTNL
jgi:hypothetical protein